ncbi:GNAT family N-acetyltransferase [Acinetobacter chinensis]|uniref:GNAT family N-acetyltransferase n=1 Tax=Acinetobacter chinensis TaxID=2004650 RepID=UPI0029348C4E|nr:GNAT family N-acetyltransferase [Acinetobacter chinensis]WOE40571.1 GNAT family N-acetyltransferase [Acinetobacter chinensis]
MDSDHDIAQLTALLDELGYPVSVENLQKRLKIIAHEPYYFTFVACDAQKVIGFMGCIKQYAWQYDGFLLRIEALIIKQEYRNQGLGHQFLSFIEDFAHEHAIHQIILNSGNRPERQAAHAFYLQNGFSISSTGFSKKID